MLLPSYSLSEFDVRPWVRRPSLHAWAGNKSFSTGRICPQAHLRGASPISSLDTLNLCTGGFALGVRSVGRAFG